MPFPRCHINSLEASRLPNENNLDPCVLHYLEPIPNHNDNDNNTTNTTTTTTTILTLVQVTPHNCPDHRDGAVVGVTVVNNDNNGLGYWIGSSSSPSHQHYVRFRLISVLAGNPVALGNEAYQRRHGDALRTLLTELRPHYIIGTCSQHATLEKPLALEFATILMAQVGPNGFYENNHNPFVFGFHVDSASYTRSAVQQLTFHALEELHEEEEEEEEEVNTIRIVHRNDRNESGFYTSTCLAAKDFADQFGFDDIVVTEYNPFADHDGDGVPNESDPDFLHRIADSFCPPRHNSASSVLAFPAIFACVWTEQTILLERWRQNGCRPESLWLTPATWNWAYRNRPSVPFVQGGSQWHQAFSYSDAFFANGTQLLQTAQDLFGYDGDYNTVVSYAIPVLFAQHLQSLYRSQPELLPLHTQRPNNTTTTNLGGYETLRRDLSNYRGDTIFGPFLLDHNQRNVGRLPAGTQWLPPHLLRPSSRNNHHHHNNSSTNATADLFQNACVSPFTHAEGPSVVPAANAESCQGGSFVNRSRIQHDDCLLCSKCSPCPVDTFSTGLNADFGCQPCPPLSSTEGQTGSTLCIRRDENLLAPALYGTGYLLLTINWAVALFCIGWTVVHRNDPVIRIGQMGFLLLICIGTMLSSSAILMLSFEAGEGEDTSAATAACMALPFLYWTGWTLQYSSLCAKTYRLYLLTKGRFRRVNLQASPMYQMVAAMVCLNTIGLIVWTIINPLEYRRRERDTYIDQENQVKVISTVGGCVLTDNSQNTLIYLGPFILIQLALLVCTNVLLWSVRHVLDRYQEQKYVLLATSCVAEVLLIGIPMLFAVSSGTSGVTYLLLVLMAFLIDFGILTMVFVPKIYFQHRGLPEGIQVGQSILRSSLSNAMERQSIHTARNSVTGSHAGSHAGDSRIESAFVDDDDPRRSIRSGDNALGTAESNHETSSSSRRRESSSGLEDP